jgi:protein phosphatase 1L
MSKRRQQKLDWTNKKYTTIPPALIQQQSYTNVVELRLSNNALKELPWEILAQAMPNLRSLWLNRNEFAELPAGVAQLNSLRKIHLEDNKIVTITPQISKLEELRKLYLNNNKLIQLPTEMHKLTQLTRLNVSNNSLKIIPSEFYCLTQLKTLNIDNNPVISPPPFMCASGTIPLLNFLRQQYDSLQKRGNRHNISSASLKNLPMDDGSRSGGKTPPMSKRTSTRPRDRERERSNSLTHSDGYTNFGANQRVYILVTHCVSQSQGLRPYMEDRYVVIPEVKLDHLHTDESLQLVDTFKTNKKRKKRRKSDASSASNEKGEAKLEDPKVKPGLEMLNEDPEENNDTPKNANNNAAVPNGNKTETVPSSARDPLKNSSASNATGGNAKPEANASGDTVEGLKVKEKKKRASDRPKKTGTPAPTPSDTQSNPHSEPTSLSPGDMPMKSSSRPELFKHKPLDPTNEQATNNDNSQSVKKKSSKRDLIREERSKDLKTQITIKDKDGIKKENENGKDENNNNKDEKKDENNNNDNKDSNSSSKDENNSDDKSTKNNKNDAEKNTGEVPITESPSSPRIYITDDTAFDPDAPPVTIDATPETIEKQVKTTSKRGFKKLRTGSVGIFGVYDGHGGGRCADYTADNLHINIMNEKEALKNDDFKTAFHKGFLNTDEQFLIKCREEGWMDGSTAVFVMLKNNRLMLGHTGDTRAVLCRGKKAIELTSDHKPDRQDEQERVEKLGGKVEVSAQTGWVPRVQGHLAVSRSLGDIRLKEPVTFVSAEPEYSEYVLGPNDQFFLIASDGIWDVMHNQQAVDIVRKCPDKYSASEQLVNKALKLGSRDNITALVVWLSWNMEYVEPAMMSSPEASVDTDSDSDAKEKSL